MLQEDIDIVLKFDIFRVFDLYSFIQLVQYKHINMKGIYQKNYSSF